MTPALPPCAPCFVYVGCRTTAARNARGTGIAIFGVDEAGVWHAQGIQRTQPNPSFLCVDSNRKRLYAVHGDHTEMTAFAIGADGGLDPLDRATTAGLNPVDLVLDPSGRHLVITNHLSNSVVARRLKQDGGFGELVGYVQITSALGPHRTEQNSPKPHQAVFDSTGTRMYVPNKGSDTISVIDLDVGTGELFERPEAAARLREGSGPRNAAVHPSLPVLFVVGELDSNVYALRICPDGKLQPFHVQSCLPPDFIGFSRASAIALSPDGKRLHVTNRGHDSLCSFDVEPGGTLSRPHWTTTAGRTPRFMCWGWNGKLIVANEESDTIISLTDPAEGTLLLATTGSPTCVVSVNPME